MLQPRRKARRVRRTLTVAEKKRLKELRRKAEQGAPAIRARGKQLKAEHDAVLKELKEAGRVLREEREAQELSLADLQERTGISRSALCRLETDLEANPTVSTLLRIANALDKKLLITLIDD